MAECNSPTSPVAAATLEAYCWGLNLTGQLGDGTNEDKTQPTPVAGGISFISLSAGGTFTCGIGVDETGYCWGWNGEGQLGDGTRQDKNQPVAVGGGLTFTQIAAGNFHTCGTTDTGEVYCWGRNSGGQLGDGTQDRATTPVRIDYDIALTAVAAGDQHSCARDTQGAVLCWGGNDAGQAGTPAGADPSTPTEVVGDMSAAQIHANGNFSCALSATGQGFCWGSNDLGQHAALSDRVCTEFDELGQITSQYACALLPVPMQNPDDDGDGISDLRFTSLTLGAHHACGIVTDGSTYCWGGGEVGELGDGQSGSTHLTPVPTRVLGQPGT